MHFACASETFFPIPLKNTAYIHMLSICLFKLFYRAKDAMFYCCCVFSIYIDYNSFQSNIFRFRNGWTECVQLFSLILFSWFSFPYHCIQFIPPPFRNTSCGNRQTLPNPIAYPMHASVNSNGFSQFPRSCILTTSGLRPLFVGVLWPEIIEFFCNERRDEKSYIKEKYKIKWTIKQQNNQNELIIKWMLLEIINVSNICRSHILTLCNIRRKVFGLLFMADVSWSIYNRLHLNQLFYSDHLIHHSTSLYLMEKQRFIFVPPNFFNKSRKNRFLKDFPKISL